MMQREISRRDFVKGMAASVAGAAAVSLLGHNTTITGMAEEAEAPAADAKKEISEVLDKDIVIVGSGAAGMLAAYEAGKAGAGSVLVISNSPNASNTNGSMVSGTCSVQTPYTEAEGETTTLDDLYDRMISFAHWTVNARLLKTCVQMMPGNIAIFDEMGIALQLAGDRYSIGFKDVHLFGTENKGEVMQKYIEDNYGVEFMFSTEGQELIMENDTCTGIIATNADGKYIQINAKAVLLACGGYISNEEMLKDTYGDMDIMALSTAWQTGKGIQMAEAAGAFRESTYGMGMSDIVGANKKAGFNLGENMLLATALFGGLLVDQYGKRFMNEYMLANESMAGGGEATLHVKKYYAIFGQKVIDALRTSGYYQYIGSPEFWVSGMLLYSNPIDNMDDRLKDAQEKGWLMVGDTIADVAAMAELPYLEATVKEYDEMAKAGKDTYFGKRAEMLLPVEDGGPYYLFEFNPGAFNTFGGCRTDEFTRALRADFSVINGLYIAGVENGSLYSRPYYDVGGTCSGLSYSSGRLAGQQMAEYVKSL